MKFSAGTYTYLSNTPLILDLEHITISPTRIPFPVFVLSFFCWNVGCRMHTFGNLCIRCVHGFLEFEVGLYRDI